MMISKKHSEQDTGNLIKLKTGINTKLPTSHGDDKGIFTTSDDDDTSCQETAVPYGYTRDTIAKRKGPTRKSISRSHKQTSSP